MYNNYGYNPYQNRYMGVAPMQQPIQQPTVNENLSVQPVNNSYKLNGMPVDSIDVVKATNIGVSGETFYFPLTNGNEIITKQLQMDGTSKITVYKPIQGKEEPKYITIDDFDDLKEQFDELKQELKELKKKKKDE